MGPQNSKIPFPVPKVWGQGEDGEIVYRFYGKNLGTRTTKLLGIVGRKFTQIFFVLGGDKGNIFWENLGTGRTKLLGIFGDKFPKIPHISGGDKSNNFGDNLEIHMFP